MVFQWFLVGCSWIFNGFSWFFDDVLAFFGRFPRIFARFVYNFSRFPTISGVLGALGVRFGPRAEDLRHALLGPLALRVPQELELSHREGALLLRRGSHREGAGRSRGGRSYRACLRAILEGRDHLILCKIGVKEALGTSMSWLEAI